jgi:hypothetical protein
MDGSPTISISNLRIEIRWAWPVVSLDHEIIGAIRDYWEVWRMNENTGNIDMELTPQDGTTNPFLDDDPLVDVDTLSYQLRQTYQQREVFLGAYRQYGTLLKAAEIANCHPDCAYQWRKRDAFHWSELWQQAVGRRREYAERKYVLDRLDKPKR